MSSESKVIKTHTSDAFVDFAYDLLAYAMPKCGHIFIKPQDYKRTSSKLFREFFGDVVLLFRNRNSHQFINLCAVIGEIDCPDDVLIFVAEAREKIFKGIVPLMEFIAYCAFLVDVAIIISLQLEDEFLIYNIVDETFDVFNMHIKPYFTIVGGWYALFRVAEQYASFVTFYPGSIPSELVDGNNADGIVKDSGTKEQPDEPLKRRNTM